MGKGKLERFAEMRDFSNVKQPTIEEIVNKKYILCGKWKSDFFKNNKPLVLELGCGKGEYTVNLAKKFPEKNFLGIDIKGARMWRGAKTAIEENISNAGFLRTRIELIQSFFEKDEVDEIWITFPDPQIKKRRAKKRLTSSKFLMSYKSFLKSTGVVHLKTDSDSLYQYTSELVKHNNLKTIFTTNDIYNHKNIDDILKIRTHYESLFLKEGKNINYISFLLDKQQLEEPPEDEN